MCNVPPKEGSTFGVLTLMMQAKYVAKGYHLTEDEDFLYLTGPGITTPVVFNAHKANLTDVENHIDTLEVNQCKS